jgi:MYXO-CTERM domain-containing protein
VTYFSGVNGTYSSARAAFEAAHLAATAQPISFENFEVFGAGSVVVGDMPGNPGRFAPEYADGSAAPLPITQAAGGLPSGSIWIINLLNGRPAGSSWVIRPDNPGDLIYAFGQSNAQGDWVRITGYDASNNVVATIEASNAGTAFAGFISDVGMSRIVVTPLGNFDLANGMDDVYVGVTHPLPAPGAAGALALGGVAAMRRRRR